MSTEIKYDDEKFRELLLYIAQQMEEDASFGATVLNKVLFFSDFFSYRFNGAPITGAVYQKLDHGPAPRRLLPEQDRLVAEKRAVIQIRQRGDFKQKRLIALDEPNLNLFTAEEISTVDTIINGLRGHGALRLSNFSHDISVGWQAAEYGEDIAYGTIFLLPPMKPTPSQEKRAKELHVEYAF